jgi:hypothetical protein
MNVPVTYARRLSVPLSPTDEELLALVRSDAGSDARAALRLASTTFSDAAFVRAVFELGIQTLHDEHEINIYRQIATDPEFGAETEGMRQRNETRSRERNND